MYWPLGFLRVIDTLSPLISASQEFQA